MPITFSDKHIHDDLQMWLDRWNAAGTRLIIHLFTNAGFVPNDDTLTSDFTEPVFCGYAPVAAQHWTAAAEDEANLRYFSHPDSVRFCATCTLTPCVTVYGWFATREEDPTVWVAADQAWPGGVQFCGPCDCLDLTPTVTDQDVTPGHA